MGCRRGFSVVLVLGLLVAGLVVVPSPVGAQGSVEVREPLVDGSFLVPPGWSLIPDGLGPGDSFRLLFVTEDVRDGSSTDIAVYDEFVQASVRGEHRGGSHSAIKPFASLFKVLGSTASVAARTHTGTDPADGSDWDVPVFWLGGSRVAAGNSSMWTEDRLSLLHAWENYSLADWRNAAGRRASPRPVLSAIGTFGTLGHYVWTGTHRSGRATSRPLGHPLWGSVGAPDSSLLLVNARSPTFQATVSRAAEGGGEAMYPLYGVSPVFTVGFVDVPVVRSAGAGSQLYRVGYRFSADPESPSRAELKFAAVYDEACPGPNVYGGIVFSCEVTPVVSGGVTVGETLVVTCNAGYVCDRPVIVFADGDYDAVFTFRAQPPPAAANVAPARGRPVTARVSSVRVTYADLDGDGDVDPLVNGQSSRGVFEFEPSTVEGVDSPVCAVTGFSWYGDPRDQYIAPSGDGPYNAAWLTDPNHPDRSIATAKRDIWPVGRPSDRDRYANPDGSFGAVMERPIYEHPDANGKCFGPYKYLLVQQGSRWRVQRIPSEDGNVVRYTTEYDVGAVDALPGVSGTVTVITRPDIPEPVEPACLQQWRDAIVGPASPGGAEITAAESNAFIDYCGEAVLDAYDRAVEQWSANVDATYGRRGYDPDVNPVINQDGAPDGREPYDPVEGTYPDQVERLEQRQEEPYLECISEEEWALLIGWWGPRCSLVWPT